MSIRHPRTVLASTLLSLFLAGGAQAVKPTISATSPRTIDEDTTSPAYAVTIDDAETAPSSLTLSVSNNPNTSLIPNGNISLGGSGKNRTITVDPAPDQNGSCVLTLRVVDGDNESAEAELSITVRPVNDPPTITTNGTRSMAEDSTPSWGVTVADIDSDVNSLTLSITGNTNSALLPTGDITFGGSGASRTIDVAPRAHDNGSANLTVQVSDGDKTATAPIAVTVTQVNDPPSVSGSLANISDASGASTLFSGISLIDVDHGPPGDPASESITVTIALDSDDQLLGNLNELTTGTTAGVNVSASNNSQFVASGNPVDLTSFVRTDLTFTPSPNAIAVGTRALDFDITVADAAGPVESEKSATFTSVNDPIAASVATSLTGFEGSPLFPFASFNAEDEDLGEQAEITITFPSTGGTFAGGSPNFTGTIAAAIDHMRGLNFTPAGGNVTFSIAVKDVHPDGSKGTAANLSTTLNVTDVNRSPEIAGITDALIRTDEGRATALFPSVEVTDADGDMLTVTVSFPSARGDLTSTAGALPFTRAAGSDDYVSNAPMSAVVASLALQSLRFTSNTTPGGVIGFTLSLADGSGGSATDSRTRVEVSNIDDSPIFSNLPSSPANISPAPPVLPFSTVTVDDDSDPITVTVSLDDPAKGELVPGATAPAFTDAGGGSYTITASPADATTALRELEFEASTTFPFPPATPGGTTFTLIATDGITPPDTEFVSVVLLANRRNHLVTKTADPPVPPFWTANSNYSAGDQVISNGNVFTRIADGSSPTFVATDWSDSAEAEGTLRVALALASPNDTITFALPGYPALIRLSSPLIIEKNLSFYGPGADQLLISGDADGDDEPDTRLFDIRKTVLIEGLGLTKGKAATGGAISVSGSGDLTLRACSVTASVASQWGGAIDVDGAMLKADGCVFADNQTDAVLGLGGGAISYYTSKPCSITNSTFSGNTQASNSGFGGGAIYAEAFSAAAGFDLDLKHCTFTTNRDIAQAGSSVQANAFGTSVLMKNCIVSDGDGGNLEVAGAATIDSAGGNVSDDRTRSNLVQGGVPQAVFHFDQSSDQTLIDPQLGALALSVGPLPGHPIAATSPAVGSAVAVASPVDGRGVLRTDGAPDSGAFEAAAPVRLLLNEIGFATPIEFLEFYNPRDSMPLDLNGSTLMVDGDPVVTFSGLAPVQPGFGLIVADGALVGNGTPVVQSAALDLEERGLVEIESASGTLLSVAYNGVFTIPSDPSSDFALGSSSITLAPQFSGNAYVPHAMALSPDTPPMNGVDPSAPGDPTSPGSDTGSKRFGASNAPPNAVGDTLLISEDLAGTLDVLANDSDADGADRVVIVDITGSTGPGQNDADANSVEGALIELEPANNGTPTTPHRALAVRYDPREVDAIQSLPQGAELVDTFEYTVVDITTGTATAFVEDLADANRTIVESPAHRLLDGVQIQIAGGGIYAGTRTISHIIVGGDPDPDRFTIATPFAGVEGAAAWEAVESRPVGAGLDDTKRDTATVQVTVLGANDSPTPVNDDVTTPEDTILRIMANSTLAGTATVFDTDPSYPLPRTISNKSLLINDEDPDSDEKDGESLRIVGVLGTVNMVEAYARTPGTTGVTVAATDHGLATDDTILIANYGGHPSYNGVHTVSVIDADRFVLPLIYIDPDMDPPPANGVWAPYDASGFLAATSASGAGVTLELRADPDETNIVYNPRPSKFLDGISMGTSETDTFYYAAMDSHGAIGLGKVSVSVTGVNDAPVPSNDPGSLALLGPPENDLSALGDSLGELGIAYLLPASDGSPDRVLVGLFDPTDPDAAAIAIDGIWSTDEATPLAILSADLTANDTDIDRSDTLTINTPNAVLTSREGAPVTVSADGSTLTYDPRVALDSLSRGEHLIDTVIVTVNDGTTGVDSLLAILVTGLNDTPQPDTLATTLTFSTPEDQLYTIGEPGVLHDDFEPDQNGTHPDDRKILVPSTGQTTPVPGVVYDTVAEGSVASSVVYDPRGSALFDGLAVGQSYTDTIGYTVWDGSYVFVMDDQFKVTADTEGADLDVLANDANLTGITTGVTLVSVSPTNTGGSVEIIDGKVRYIPAPGFVGDEVFTYVAEDELGNSDRGQVSVRVTVEPLNGNLQAGDDAFSVALGQAPVLAVLANDDVLPGGSGALEITNITSPPALGTAEMVAGGILYTPGAATGMDSFEYELSGGGSARATATVSVEIIDRAAALFTRNDAFSVPVGSDDNSLDVLANDNILPGNGTALTVSVVTPPGHGTLAPNALADALVYTPNAGFTGIDTFTYGADDSFGGTGTATATVTVGNLVTNSDFFVTSDAAADQVLDVLANDLVLETPEGTIVITGFSATENGTPDTTLTLGTLGDLNLVGGEIQFTASAAAGEETFFYTITDGDRTARGMASVAVVADGVSANADFFSVLVDSAPADLDVLSNDMAVPLRPLTLVSIGTGLDAPDQGGNAQIVTTPNGQRIRYQPAAGFVGEETFTYTITDSARSDTTTVVVRVGGGDLYANGDTYTVFYELGAESPVSFTLPVLSNDVLLPDGDTELIITGVGIDETGDPNAPDKAGTVTIKPDGKALVYTPAENPALPAGFRFPERFTYIISDGTARRAEAQVVVEVRDRDGARAMETKDDSFTLAAGSLNNNLDVLANDGVKPAPTSGWTITGVGTPTLFPAGSSDGGAATTSGSAVIYSPPAGFVGTASFEYSVSDGLGGTGTATVVVKVGDVRLSDDRFAALEGSTSDLDVLANDGVLPDMPEGSPPGGYLFDTAAITPDRGGSATVVGDQIRYAPAPGFVGIERFEYWVLDNSGNRYPGEVVVEVQAPGADRATGSAEIVVTGVNDLPVIEATRSFEITDKQVIDPFAGVILTDVDDQGQEALTLSLELGDPASGILYHPDGLLFRDGNRLVSNAMTPADATAALRGVLFQPTPDLRVSPGSPEAVAISLSVDDGHASVTDSSTMVTAEHPPQSHVLPVELPGGGDASMVGAKFGAAVAVSGNLMAVGSPMRNSVGTNSGAIFVFERVTIEGGDRWQQVTRVLADDIAPGDRFGDSLALDGEVLVVGAPRRDAGGGAAYIFARDAGGADSWGQVKKLIIESPARAADDRFGTSVGISGNTVVVGAQFADRERINSGMARVYERHLGGAENWGLRQEIVQDVARQIDWFGKSVAIDGDTIVVGAHGSNKGDDPEEYDFGAAFVFERAGAPEQPWLQVKKLDRFDDVRSSRDDNFGWSVDISGDDVIIGAPRFDPVDGISNSGAAFLFGRDVGGGDNWGLRRELPAASPVEQDRFGQSVAVGDGIALVGAVNPDSPTHAGFVECYVRDLGTDAWRHTDTLNAPDPDERPAFGYGVDVNSIAALVGAPYDGDNPSDRDRAGAVYAHQLQLENPTPFDLIAGQWQVANFSAETVRRRAVQSEIWGLSADPDCDGYNNGLELLMGSDPQLKNQDVMLRLQTGADGAISLVYRRDKDFPEQYQRAVWSTDLRVWSTAGTTESLEADLGDNEMIRAYLESGARGRIFWRIDVGMP